MTREEIEKFSEEEPYCFGYCGEEQKMREDRWYEIGCIDGLRVADAEPNLESLWHDANEEPQGEYKIICQDEFEHVWLTDWREVVKQHTNGWEEYAACECVVHWAYVSDITPKGCKK